MWTGPPYRSEFCEVRADGDCGEVRVKSTVPYDRQTDRPTHGSICCRLYSVGKVGPKRVEKKPADWKEARVTPEWSSVRKNVSGEHNKGGGKKEAGNNSGAAGRGMLVSLPS